jgi:hypothetical protein
MLGMLSFSTDSCTASVSGNRPALPFTMPKIPDLDAAQGQMCQKAFRNPSKCIVAILPLGHPVEVNKWKHRALPSHQTRLCIQSH